MRLILVGLLLSILAVAQSHAEMSFPPQNSFTAVNKVSSGQLVASTTNFTLDVGDKIFVHVAKDNVSPGDGETNEVVSVEDSFGNTYVKIKEFSNGQGKKLAGVVAALFLATNIASYPPPEPKPFATIPPESFIVTVRFSTSNVAAKTMAVQRVISRYDLEVVDFAFLANDNANPSKMDLENVPPDVEHLWVRTMGLEGAWVNFFETPSYDDWGTIGTTGSGRASNIAVAYEADIFTGTSNPSDPIAINADSVSILVAFREIIEP